MHSLHRLKFLSFHVIVKLKQGQSDSHVALQGQYNSQTELAFWQLRSQSSVQDC